MLNDFWSSLASHFSWILVAIYVFTILSTAAMIIHEKRDPAKTSTWVLLLIVLPVFGLVLYIFFGQTYRKQKIFSRKEIQDLEQIKYLDHLRIGRFKTNKVINEKLHKYHHNITLLQNNSKALLTENNDIEIYHEGEFAFEAIIEELYAAKDSIHIEFYIINNDNIGNRIKNILISKVKEGVTVRVIFDDVGSWHLPKSYIKELRNAGVEIGPFMEVKFPLLTSKVNYRNHRKIIVIDGKVAFMGGMNIADRYIEGDRKLGKWFDIMLRFHGEAVHSLQVIFLADWYFVTGKVLKDKQRYFKKIEVDNLLPLQIITSGPDSDWAGIMQAFFYAITRASNYIYISSPYFIPNESILTALKTAALSGVDVRIILPQHSDSTVVYWSSMSFVTELLEAGIKIYLFKTGFNHSKLMVIDGSFASVGSANMDIRSFEDNFEVAAIIYDDSVASRLEKLYLDFTKNSDQVTLETWRKRSLKNSYKEAFARLISPLF